MACHIGGMANDVTTRELTAMQAAFVREFVNNGGNGTRAAIAAGYGEIGAAQEASRTLTLPHVCAALHIEREKRLARISTAAIDLLEQVILDDDAPVAQRVRCAMTVLDRAGHTPTKRGDAPGNDEKRPENMNKSELEAFIRKATSQLREASVPVLNAAVDAAGNAQVVDIIDVDPA